MPVISFVLGVKNKGLRLVYVVLLLAVVMVAGRAMATEIPFDGRQVIEGNLAGAFGVETADIDGDGDLDVVSAAFEADSVHWWENTAGDGSAWTGHLVSGTFNGALRVATGDVDQDGDLDILATALGAGDVAWWENTAGDGSAWTVHTIEGNFSGAWAVDSADMDSDGDLDAIGSTSSDLAWWENTAGDGSAWTVHFVENGTGGPRLVEAADLDGDGDLDLYGASNSGSVILAWWENENGDGLSWQRDDIDNSGPASESADAADVDGDGDLDLLSTHSFNDDVTWWENSNGDGSAWSAHLVEQNVDFPNSVQAADMDVDGDIDVIGTAYNANQVVWWENSDGDGLGWLAHPIEGSYQGAVITSGDIDGDGDPDVLATAETAGDLAWWENETLHRNALYRDKQTVDGDFNAAFTVHAADLDNDGDEDIVGGAATANDVAWWENTAGDGSAWTKEVIDGSFAIVRSVDTADVDGDGDLDVLGASVGSNTIAWWENRLRDELAWVKHTVGSGFSGAFWTYAADIDNDGDEDVLGAAFGGNAITWWENMDGSGLTWSAHNLDNAFTSAAGVYAADLDGDGDLDVVGAAYGASDVVWWENRLRDSLPWSRHSVDTAFGGAVGIYAVDMDGDGDNDIQGAANGDQTFTWWENVNGNGLSWTRQDVGTGFGNAEGVYAADVDNDGDNDILGAAQIANTMAWWENAAGDGSTWNEHIVDDNVAEAVSVYAADLDGDGDLELLGAAAVDNDINWWRNEGGQFGLVTADTAPTTIASGARDDVLKITVNHNGRTANRALEWASVALLFEEAAGDALTTAEANAIIGNLHLYLDDGSGTFAAGSDTLVTTVATLTLSSGVQAIALPDGNANLQVEFGAPRTYFVVVEVAAEAHFQSPDSFRLTHLTEGAVVSTAEDADFDIPLTLAYAADVSSAVVAIPANVAPSAGDDSYTAAVNEPLVVGAPGVLANDSDGNGDGLAAVVVSLPAHGSLALDPDGSFVYTPALNFEGSDSFTYEASDGVLADMATVTIAVETQGYFVYLPVVVRSGGQK